MDERYWIWVNAGNTALLRQLDGMTEADLAGPSLLPGWSRAHVLAHLARNADALGNLLSWARTGVETPMYPSREKRNADIEACAKHPATELFADVRDSAERLALAMAELPESAWAARIRSNQGKDLPASEIVWMRCQELWVHGVDLNMGESFSALPRDFSDRLLAEVAETHCGKPDCPDAELRPADGEAIVRIGSGSPGATVTGTTADLLGWVLGRTSTGLTTTAGELPTPPAWR